MDLILLLLHFELHFLVLVRQVLQFELDTVILRLNLTILVFEIL